MRRVPKSKPKREAMDEPFGTKSVSANSSAGPHPGPLPQGEGAVWCRRWPLLSRLRPSPPNSQTRSNDVGRIRLKPTVGPGNDLHHIAVAPRFRGLFELTLTTPQKGGMREPRSHCHGPMCSLW